MKGILGSMLVLALLALAGCGPRETPGAGDVAPLTEDAAPSNAPVGQEAVVEPVPFTNVSVTVRRNGQWVSERAVTLEAEIDMAEQLVFSYLARSAAWPGSPASELADWVCLSYDWIPGEARQFYYQYDVDGRHVLQAGEEGMYSILADEEYAMLMELAGLPLETDGGAIGVERATALLEEQLGTADPDTGNTFSYGYVETLTLEGREYYRFRMSWLVDDHLSYLTDYLVAADGSGIREYQPEPGQ